jgi:hypothetical protein
MNPSIISFSQPFKSRGDSESMVDRVLHSDKNLRIRNHLTGLMKSAEVRLGSGVVD